MQQGVDFHSRLQQMGIIFIKSNQLPSRFSAFQCTLETPNGQQHTFYTELHNSVGTADISRMKSRLASINQSLGHSNLKPLIIATHKITSAARERLQALDGSYINLAKGAASINGLVYGQTEPRRTALRSTSRSTWYQYALARVIILGGGDLNQVELAALLGTTQVTISRNLRALRATVDVTTPSGRSPRQQLLNYLEDIYPPRQDIETYWFASAPLTQQAEYVHSALRREHAEFADGALLAADKYAPWKHPQQALIYSSKLLDLERVGFVETSPETSTLRLSTPADPTCLKTALWWSQLQGYRIPYTDPVQTYIDIYQAKDSDVRQAAQQLRTKLIDGKNL